MPLTCPSYAIPGELLQSNTSVEKQHSWLPDRVIDICDHRVGLEYGDLWLVLASWKDSCKSKQDIHDPWDEVIYQTFPVLLLHLRTNKIVKIDDIDRARWLWRPSEDT